MTINTVSSVKKKSFRGDAFKWVSFKSPCPQEGENSYSWRVLPEKLRKQQAGSH